jgi:photosystem II stability/assembly factor-like uncharacterized protein
MRVKPSIARSAAVSALSLALLFTVSSAAQDSVTHVSRMVPVHTAARALFAERPVVVPELTARPRTSNVAANTWNLLATLPGTIIHDMAFTSATTGFAAAEGGQVWKTTNGGGTWTEILNLGFPYYFYGVWALNPKDVVVSGFYDSSTNWEGLIRWTHDGGKTWSSDIVLSTNLLTDGWLGRVRFANLSDGLILDLDNGTAQYTTDGGAAVTDWTSVAGNPSGAWFGLQFSFLNNLHARASGINFCTSLNAGAAWTCGPSVDSVFDDAVLFQGDSLGWVGGGEISPNVEGWIHITTNGGRTWSGRTLDGPWPIRQFVFTTTKTGWAAGGNVYTGVGGLYYTGDGGNTWSVDATTNAEMDACAERPLKTGGHQVWCAGYTSSLNGVIYSAVTP